MGQSLPAACKQRRIFDNKRFMTASLSKTYVICIIEYLASANSICGNLLSRSAKEVVPMRLKLRFVQGSATIQGQAERKVQAGSCSG